MHCSSKSTVLTHVSVSVVQSCFQEVVKKPSFSLGFIWFILQVLASVTDSAKSNKTWMMVRKLLDQMLGWDWAGHGREANLIPTPNPGIHRRSSQKLTRLAVHCYHGGDWTIWGSLGCWAHREGKQETLGREEAQCPPLKQQSIKLLRKRLDLWAVS